MLEHSQEIRNNTIDKSNPESPVINSFGFAHNQFEGPFFTYDNKKPAGDVVINKKLIEFANTMSKSK